LPDGSGTQTTATVAGLHFERNQFGGVCAVSSVTVHGSFQYWTGALSVTMTQDPPAQPQQTCSSPEGTRLALADALDCTAGTFNLTGWTTKPPRRSSGRPGGMEGARLAVAGGEQHHQPLGRQPPDHKHQRIR
jgi:hypothetical protein